MEQDYEDTSSYLADASLFDDGTQLQSYLDTTRTVITLLPLILLIRAFYNTLIIPSMQKSIKKKSLLIIVSQAEDLALYFTPLVLRSLDQGCKVTVLGLGRHGA